MSSRCSLELREDADHGARVARAKPGVEPGEERMVRVRSEPMFDTCANAEHRVQSVVEANSSDRRGRGARPGIRCVRKIGFPNERHAADAFREPLIAVAEAVADRGQETRVKRRLGVGHARRAIVVVSDIRLPFDAEQPIRREIEAVAREGARCDRVRTVGSRSVHETGGPKRRRAEAAAELQTDVRPRPAVRRRRREDRSARETRRDVGRVGDRGERENRERRGSGERETLHLAAVHVKDPLLKPLHVFTLLLLRGRYEKGASHRDWPSSITLTYYLSMCQVLCWCTKNTLINQGEIDRPSLRQSSPRKTLHHLPQMQFFVRERVKQMV